MNNVEIENMIKSAGDKNNFKIINIEYFAKGKRGLIFTGVLEKSIRHSKKIKVAIKIKNPESEAIARIENEAKWLRKLNKFGIGPEIYYSDENLLITEFIEGKFIGDFLDKGSRKEIMSVIKKIFLQLFTLDKLKIDKEEMHHPTKHIIIDSKGKPVLIDFERARIADKPKNVTQFCQYISSNFASTILEKKGINLNKNKLIGLARNYKNSINKKNLNEIINYVSAPDD